jgi:hypothetical protein
VSRSTVLIAAAAVLIAAGAFGAGYGLARDGPARVPIYTAGGYVGVDQASFQVGDTTYGFEGSVAWRDPTGTEHDGGWPSCLPKLQTVQGIRFAGADLRYDAFGNALVVWIDCQR